MMRALVLIALLGAGCDLANPADSSEYLPARLSMGPLEIAAWLPAGMGTEVRLDEDQLVGLGITHLEWLQRAEAGGLSAETLAMQFCSRAGLRMPVYYEPPGYSPYDKLRNWATKSHVGEGFDDSLAARAQALVDHWRGEPGLAGYLIGHEDYSRDYYPALARTVGALARAGALHPAYTVGNIDSYAKRERFLDAFFQEGGAANIFQHEHYVFRADVPDSGRVVERRLDDLAAGYGRVARAVQGRNGRWQAIIQSHAETRGGTAYYRQPSPAELRVQAGLALARGASGIVYFLHSSGEERVLNSAGEVIQVRTYDGLVSEEGRLSETYLGAADLNAQLAALSPVLEPLHFHGGYRGDRLPRGTPLMPADADLDFGFYGDGQTISHVLVVNRLTHRGREAGLVVPDYRIDEVHTGAVLGDSRATLTLAAGDFQLVRLIPRAQ